VRVSTSWLNYHHLQYFWTVAKEGSIAAASKKLRLAQPTISTQIKTLEEQLGVVLFDRSGRTLVLTEVGQRVFSYAESIFSLGLEMIESLQEGALARQRLRIGLTQAIPKQVAYRLLQPALGGDNLHIICSEDRSIRLLARLASHDLDLVISDAPLGPDADIHANAQLIGQSPISFFAAPAMAKQLRREFPRSLEGARLLLPLQGSVLRRELDLWFDAEQLRPDVVGEFEDSALVKVFGQSGVGAFVAPSVLESEIVAQYQVQAFGRTDAVHERYYAISTERGLSHPGVLAIWKSFHADIFPTD
jgi:LysR family transcriptional regulator, transcriptional activator of nhaA